MKVVLATVGGGMSERRAGPEGLLELLEVGLKATVEQLPQGSRRAAQSSHHRRPSPSIRLRDGA